MGLGKSWRSGDASSWRSGCRASLGAEALILQTCGLRHMRTGILGTKGLAIWIGDRMASNLRIGHGYDVHRLVEGRRCIIGGVDIRTIRACWATATPTCWRMRWPTRSSGPAAAAHRQALPRHGPRIRGCRLPGPARSSDGACPWLGLRVRRRGLHSGVPGAQDHPASRCHAREPGARHRLPG